MINMALVSMMYNQPRVENAIPGPEAGVPLPKIDFRELKRVLGYAGYVFLAPFFLFTGCKVKSRDGSNPKVLILVESLKSSDAKVRVRSARMLGTMGANAYEAVPALINALKDANSDVRGSVVDALGKIGPKAAAAVPALVELLKKGRSTKKVEPTDSSFLNELMDNSDWPVRTNAAKALGKIGTNGVSVIPALVEALSDNKWAVRLYAAKALGNFGPKAFAAIDALTKTLNDGHPLVSEEARSALKKIRGE